jgi:predicted anti-sigma-YlaC factor YlaD
MTHITEDKLLEFALQTLPAQSEQATTIEAHILKCPECTARLDKIRQDIETIGSIKWQQGRTLSLHDSAISRLRRRRRHHQNFTYALWRVAAMILISFCLGAVTSDWMQQKPATVTPSYFILSPPADSLRGFPISDATEIKDDYNFMISRN